MERSLNADTVRGTVGSFRSALQDGEKLEVKDVWQIVTDCEALEIFTEPDVYPTYILMLAFLKVHGEL